jgi:hypothetical protein
LGDELEHLVDRRLGNGDRIGPVHGGSSPSLASDGFAPANFAELALLVAAGKDDPGLFLKVVLGATVLVPVDAGTPPDAAPTAAGGLRKRAGQRSVLVFTSEDRLVDYFRSLVPSLRTTVTDLLQHWPEPSLTLGRSTPGLRSARSCRRACASLTTKWP